MARCKDVQMGIEGTSMEHAFLDRGTVGKLFGAALVKGADSWLTRFAGKFLFDFGMVRGYLRRLAFWLKLFSPCRDSVAHGISNEFTEPVWLMQLI